MPFPNLALASPHVKGPKVADAQWLLSGHNRFSKKFYSGPLDSDWGPLCGAAAHAAKYYLGYPTSQINDVFGAEIYSYLLPMNHLGWRRLPVAYRLRRALRLKAAAKAATQLTLGEKALAEARKYLNYREAPVNKTMFGQWYGMDGVPWCNIFCSFVVSHVGRAFKQSYVPTTLALARASQQGLSVTINPQPGDFALYDWNNDGTYDHIGFFEKWTDQAAGKFAAIEGNTLPPGGQGDQSNGGGVYNPVRGTKDGYHVTFVRWY